METHYDILGVSRTATYEEIRASYKKLAMKWHPDRHEQDKKAHAESTFIKIQTAYAVLSDEGKRATYDFNTRPSPGGNPFNYFSDYGFGTSSKAHEYYDVRAERPRGANVKKSVTIPVETAIHGGKVNIAFTEREECPECDGYGDFVVQCNLCHGTGRHTRHICPHCIGRGEVVEDCDVCDGTAHINVTKNVTVNLPRGLIDGSTLIVDERGKASKSGGYNGDLLITIKIRQSVSWKYKAADIHGLLKIPFPTAMLGGICSIELPTGKTVDVTVPPHTNAGKKFKLDGMGLYDGKDKVRGDVILSVTITLGTKRKLNADEEALLRSLG